MESFVENVKRAHHQTAQWKTALTGDPPSIDARNYGYEEDLHNKMLFPLNMSPGTPYAPDYILKLIRCSCGSTGAANPCKGSNCSCAGNQIPCTIFCNCGGGKTCHNHFNANTEDEIDDE